jgi:site-specific DNA-methyltransferase (adenine-specific)
MKTIQDKSIDAIITDPPYGTTACKWDSVIPFEPMWEQLNRIIKPNGAIVLFGSEPFSSALRMSNIKNYKYDWYLRKNKTTGFLNAKKQPLRKYEIISVFYSKQVNFNPQFTIGKEHGSGGGKNKDKTDVYRKQKTLKPKSKTNLYYPNNEIEYKYIKKPQHPTQKPVAIMEYLIKTYTNKNETVLDFTMGSGSTGVACVNAKRNFIGIEIDENYFNIAKKRINKHKNQQILF